MLAQAAQHFSAADGRKPLVLAFAVIRLLALCGYDKTDSYESLEAIIAQERGEEMALKTFDIAGLVRPTIGKKCCAKVSYFSLFVQAFSPLLL